jgi:TPR repeat protein
LRWRSALLLALLLLAAQPPLQAQVPEDIRAALTGRGHALLIGVARYDDRAGWHDLDSVTGDLEDLRRELAPHFQSIDVLPNPTTEEIRQRLRAFLTERGAAHDARLLIYYAGHGFTAHNPASQQTMGYITGRDTPRCQDASCRSALGNAIPFNEIDALNRGTWARHVLMLFDSCFSGSIFLTRSESQEVQRYTRERARTALREPVRYYITAGSADDPVPAQSPFASLVIRGLRGEADVHRDGVISAEALGVFLQRHVPAAARRDTLRPQKGPIADGRLSRGQFLFLTGLGSTVARDMSAAEIVRRAAEARRRGDDREAARLYQIGVEQGDAEAQARLGEFYANGTGGLIRDDVRAAQLLRLSADQGNADAQYILGLFYEWGRGGVSGGPAEARRLFQRAADGRHPGAMASLSSYYFHGNGGRRDRAEAFRLLRASANLGNPTGQTMLAQHLLVGFPPDLPRNTEEALRLLRLAARAGFMPAQQELRSYGQDW